MERLLRRLFRRGIGDVEYSRIKAAITFAVPSGMIRYQLQFEGRPISSVTRQIDRSKEFLDRNTVPSASTRAALETDVSVAEVSMWNALEETGLDTIGEWKLEWSLVPTGSDERGRPLYIFPDLRVTAVHPDGTRKTAEVSGQDLTASTLVSARVDALKKLGLWDLACKAKVPRLTSSSRRKGAWPVYTRLVIPRLYECLIPYYPAAPHHSERIDKADTRRNARFPGELFRDMLEILQIEHPRAFSDTTAADLKAAVQRYLERKSTGTAPLP